MVNNLRRALPGRPADGKHIESGRVLEQLLSLQEVQGQTREPALLRVIDRGGGPRHLALCRRTYLDKDEASAVKSDQVQLTDRTAVIADQHAVAELLEKPRRSTFRARAEPAPPPRTGGAGRCILSYPFSLVPHDFPQDKPGGLSLLAAIPSSMPAIMLQICDRKTEKDSRFSPQVPRLAGTAKSPLTWLASLIFGRIMIDQRVCFLSLARSRSKPIAASTSISPEPGCVAELVTS